MKFGMNTELYDFKDLPRDFVLLTILTKILINSVVSCCSDSSFSRSPISKSDRSSSQYPVSSSS